jgi:hypothetical protein
MIDISHVPALTFTEVSFSTLLFTLNLWESSHILEIDGPSSAKELGADVAITHFAFPDAGSTLVKFIGASIQAESKSRPKAALFSRADRPSSGVQRQAIPAAITQEAEPRKTQDQHRPGRGLWNCRNRGVSKLELQIGSNLIAVSIK